MTRKYRKKTIYFLKPVGMDGPIKIGVTFVPVERLINYMRWSPIALEIVATVEGGAGDETLLHRCFADFHSHGEWFLANDRLSKLIAAFNAGEGIEYARQTLAPKRVLSKIDLYPEPGVYRRPARRNWEARLARCQRLSARAS